MSEYVIKTIDEDNVESTFDTAHEKQTALERFRFCAKVYGADHDVVIQARGREVKRHYH